MSEIIVAALIGAGITLLTTIVTVVVNARVENNKRKIEIMQRDFETKRDNLSKIYKKLLSIVDSYPNVSPNDILISLEYPPNYSMESFDAIISILRYQIDDCSHKLKNEGVDLSEKSELEVGISNKKYFIKQIEQNRDDYFDACNKYREFCKTDKMIFDLYAGQDVKNSLVDFEVIIHNTFKSGRRVGDSYDSTKNTIDIARHMMTMSMRSDIGID